MQRMHRFGISVHQKSFCGRALPGPAGEAYRAPTGPLAVLQGKGREGKMEGGRLEPKD